MIISIVFLFLTLINFAICWAIPPAEVPVLGGDHASSGTGGIPDYSGINDADIETEILSGNAGNSGSDSYGSSNADETVVNSGIESESNGFNGLAAGGNDGYNGGGFSGSHGYKEAVLVPKRQRRILARYKVIIPVIIPQIRMRLPNNNRGGGSYNRGRGSNIFGDDSEDSTYNGRHSQNPG